MKNKNLSLIKGHIIRLDYAKEKIEKTLNINLGIPQHKQKEINYKKYLRWYKKNVEYHTSKIMERLSLIDDGITKRAEEETKSIIKREKVKK